MSSAKSGHNKSHCHPEINFNFIGARGRCNSQDTCKTKHSSMISKQLAKKIAAYSVMAETFMLCHQKADAQIMYTDVNPDIVFHPNDNYFMDLNNDGVSDFKLEITSFYTGSIWNGFSSEKEWSVIPLGQNALKMLQYSGYNPDQLPTPVASGDDISATDIFTINPVLKKIINYPNTYANYGYCYGYDEIIGLKLVVGSSNYYGWMRLDVQFNEIVLKDYAINKNPDEPIIAGVNANCNLSQITTNPVSQGWICTDSISINVLNASGYSYQWLNNLHHIVGETDSVFTTIQVGNYGVFVYDSACAVLLNSIRVDTLPTMVPSLYTNHIPEHCHDSDGAIYLYLENDSAYTYLWSNGATTQNIQNISAGNYTVTVSSCNGNTGIIADTLVNYPIISETHTNSCNANIGTIDLSVTNLYSETYLWSNGAVNEDLFNLAPGNYSVTVTDNLGCEDSLSVDINNSFQIDLSETHPDTICGYKEGYVNLTISGILPGYSILWSNGSATQNLVNLTSGSYSVTASNTNGCYAVHSLIIENKVEAPSISVSNFILYSSYNGKNQWYLNSLSNPLLDDTLNYLSPPSNGYYYVEAIYPDSCTNISNRVHIGFVTGIEDLNIESLQISVTDKKLTFHLANNDLMGAQIDILNELGARVTTVTVSNQTPSADLSNMAAGIYFYHIRTKQKTYNGKFLIE